MVFLAAGEHIDALVHPSVVNDRRLFACHRRFIASHLLIGIVTFALLPLSLLLRGAPPSPVEFMMLVWLAGPLAIAFDLSRTGDLERAHGLSAMSVIGLVFLVAALSGGITSLVLTCLPFVVMGVAYGATPLKLRACAAAIGIGLAALVALQALGSPALTATTPAGLAAAVALLVGAILFHAAGTAPRRGDARADTGVEQPDHAFLNAYSADLVTRHAVNGTVTFASAGSRALLGLEGQELLGRCLFERVHIADRPAFLTALSDVRNGGSRTVELRLRKAAGHEPGPPQYIWAEMRCTAVPAGSAGGDPQILAVTRDISGQRAREDDLRQASVDAGNADAAKGRFLANMSHELRTPLNAIIGFSELLVSNGLRGFDEARRQEYAGLIHESGLHLLSVVNGLLDLSRIESGNMAVSQEPFALRPVVDSCVNMFSLKASQGSITLRSDVSDALPDVWADKRACKQIMINLLSNAIKFTPQGGRVAISARRQGGEMVIEVQDTGLGISPEHLPKLGTSFFQVRSTYDRPFEGTGLGLSVVKGLIALQAGTFKVESQLGHGTKVIVRLPLTDAAAEPAPIPLKSNVIIPQRIAAHG